jgi:hypothetical protein
MPSREFLTAAKWYDQELIPCKVDIKLSGSEVHREASRSSSRLWAVLYYSPKIGWQSYPILATQLSPLLRLQF